MDLEGKCLNKWKLSSKEQIDYMKFKGLTFDFIENALKMLYTNVRNRKEWEAGFYELCS